MVTPPLSQTQSFYSVQLLCYLTSVVWLFSYITVWMRTILWGRVEGKKKSDALPTETEMTRQMYLSLTPGQRQEAAHTESRNRQTLTLRGDQSVSAVLMERFELHLSSLQLMGSSLFAGCSHIDSSHRATFPGTQRGTEALCVTFFSIFMLCNNVMTVPCGARVYSRPAETTRPDFTPIITGQMRHTEK